MVLHSIELPKPIVSKCNYKLKTSVKAVAQMQCYMHWRLTENKAPKGQQEIKIKLLLIEMAEYSYATYAEAFENHFKQLVGDIPRTNNFSADLMYKVIHRNVKSVEVWKMTPQGDFKSKMFTLDYVGA